MQILEDTTIIFGHILQWDNRDLTEFPEEMIRLNTKVKKLYFQNNHISYLPNWFCTMQNLSHVYLGFNNLEIIPDELSLMTNLEVLSVPCNSIKYLPASMARLPILKHLDVSHNCITNIPDDFFRMKQLLSLDLSHNQITKLPDIRVDGSVLTQLHLDNNYLLTVPENLSTLNNLEVLSLNGNRLLYFPALPLYKANISVERNPYLNYVFVPVQYKYYAENSGTENFRYLHKIDNVVLNCLGRNLIMPSKIKHVLSVNDDAYCPSLKEFALRILNKTQIKVSENELPKNLYSQLSSGPVAMCLQCERSMFTYAVVCIFNHGYRSLYIFGNNNLKWSISNCENVMRLNMHLMVQLFCSKTCEETHSRYKKTRYGIVTPYIDFKWNKLET